MKGKFVIAKEVEKEVLDWGTLRWLSNPPATGAREALILQAALIVGSINEPDAPRRH